MPDFNVIKIGCIVVILLVLLIAAVIITVKREKSKRKIRRMCDAEKIQLLNELAEPFGFVMCRVKTCSRRGKMRGRENRGMRRFTTGQQWEQAWCLMHCLSILIMLAKPG